MATVQKKGSAFYCQSFYQNKRYTVTVGRVSQAQAEAFVTRTEELIGLLKRGRLTLPEGVSITDFVLRDGRLAEKAKVEERQVPEAATATPSRQPKSTKGPDPYPGQPQGEVPGGALRRVDKEEYPGDGTHASGTFREHPGCRLRADRLDPG